MPSKNAKAPVPPQTYAAETGPPEWVSEVAEGNRFSVEETTRDDQGNITGTSTVVVEVTSIEDLPDGATVISAKEVQS